MADHVIIRKLEHLTGDSRAPSLGYAVETRESAGPAHKNGAFEDDLVWIKLHGGLMIGKARIKLGWVGQYSSIAEIRRRTRGSAIHDVDAFWVGRPKVGFAAVAELKSERWIEPHWAGPRTYGYDWVILDDKKRQSWLEDKPPPRGGEDLLERFLQWRERAG